MNFTIKLYDELDKEIISTEQQYIHGKSNYFFPQATSNWGTITHAVVCFQGQEFVASFPRPYVISASDVVSLLFEDMDSIVIDLVIKSINARNAAAREVAKAEQQQTLRRIKLDHLKQSLLIERPLLPSSEFSRCQRTAMAGTGVELDDLVNSLQASLDPTTT